VNRTYQMRPLLDVNVTINANNSQNGEVESAEVLAVLLCNNYNNNITI
jgi:hypothetical protein